MTPLDQLQEVIVKVAHGLALEMAAAGTDKDVLSIDNITVDQTADGVVVHFIEGGERPTVGKKSPKPMKRTDES